MKRPTIGAVAVKWTSVLLFVTARATSIAGEGTPVPPPAPAFGLAETNDTRPSIQFAAPVHDFGQVTGGEVARHAFVFTNAGGSLLETLARC